MITKHWDNHINTNNIQGFINDEDENAYEAVRLDLIENIAFEKCLTVEDATKLFDATGVALCCRKRLSPILHEDYRYLLDIIYRK